VSDSVNPPRHTNRLINESSPYLLQHAHNPVDWHAWGPEAFEIARRENKPIFLSVGYSTCYWCHVMERQCFEVEAIAAEMNQRFVNIKVDREERPDVDQLYMTAVQVLTRQGGWPMSVFLTPDLRPFYGGTYFPPTDAHGRPGFVSVLRGIEDAYRDRPKDVEQTAGQLVKILADVAEPAAPDEPITIDEAFVEDLIRRSISDCDARFGGFGGAPKFPRETLLELLLTYIQPAAPAQGSAAANPPAAAPTPPPGAATLKGEIAGMLRHTLDTMADGGIRDQLGGGFHRYSTDARWLVPHFEIMLYDNAMLAWCYVEAYRQFKEPRYAAVAHGIFDFILREMTSPDGAFHTAFDAEVDAQEGLSYLWTAAEVEAILGSDDARLFNHVYGLDRGPNFADPHHCTGEQDKNILHLPQTMQAAAKELKTDPAALESRLVPMRQKLYTVRLKRKQPGLDTKIITSWNALMIRAMAFGGHVLGEPRYLQAAAHAADFLLGRHRAPGGGLYRASRDGKAKYAGFLDDYAYLVQALLALFTATGDEKWTASAGEIAAAMVEKFADANLGGFFFTEQNAPDLIVRQKTGTDSPLPSGNAVAAMAMLELGQVAEAQRTLAVFANQIAGNGEGMSAMVQAALLYLRRAETFTISADARGAGATRPPSPEQIAQRVVAVHGAWASPTELHVRLNILEGFHINAHQTTGSAPLIATSLKLVDADAGAEILYPPGNPLRLALSDEPIQVYTDNVTLVVKLSAAPPSGDPLKMTLAYQACDDSSCLSPITKYLEIAV